MQKYFGSFSFYLWWFGSLLIVAGKDSPSSKLLYAKDIPIYKDWVTRYYQVIYANFLFFHSLRKGWSLHVTVMWFLKLCK